MNQRGFVVAPIIIWLVVGLFAVVAINNSYSKGTPYEQSDLAKIGKPLDTPTVVPTPTPIPIASSSDLINPVKQYYSDISSKQYYDAWTQLSKNFQNYAQGYDLFVKGYSTTIAISLNNIHVQDLTNDTVFVNLASVDNINGQTQNQTYSGTWKLVYEDSSWKLEAANIKLLTPVAVIKSPTPVPTDIPVTHDGSRTGKIIDYFEMNSGKQIKVYENELLPFTDIRGKFGYYTQKDIDWDKKVFGDPNDPVEKCSNSNCKDIQMKRSLCNNPNGGYICCTVRNQTAWLTQSQCTDDQNQFNPKPPTEQEKVEANKQAAADLLNAYQKCLKCTVMSATDHINGDDENECYTRHKDYCDASLKNGCFYNGSWCGDGEWPF